MKNSLFASLLFGAFLSTTFLNCNAQTKPNLKNEKKQIVGGGCDGCELMYIGMPATINVADTSAGWYSAGQKLLVKGKVYKVDGKTPAPNVVIYYWQTDNDGNYTPKDGMDESAKRHGYIRGWVKTNESGEYSIYTVRPAPYPKRTDPAHIHASVKEPGINNEYYIDDFVFNDDKFLTSAKRNEQENRGGSGILKVFVSGDEQISERNIILGLNVPGYPKQ